MSPGTKAFWELLFWHLIKLWARMGHSPPPVRFSGSASICLSWMGVFCFPDAPSALHHDVLGDWSHPDPRSLQACAVGLIAVGVAAQYVLSQTISQEATPGSVLLVVIIAVGAFLFLVAIVGCCGACKENSCLMITVSGLWGQCGGVGLL